LKVVGDLTNLNICKKVVEDAVQKFGKINILVRDVLMINYLFIEVLTVIS
jgi:hypothetical protein